MIWTEEHASLALSHVLKIATKVSYLQTHTTAADVWTRRVIVWIVFGSMEVEAMSCKDEWLDAAEMFCEDP